jgi:outer membrane autotransporter protein
LLAGTVEDTADWVGRAEVRLDGAYNGGKLNPYVSVSYTDTLDGDGQTTTLGNALVESRTANDTLGLNIGLNSQVSSNVSLFVDAGLTQGLSDDVKGYQGSVGLKMTW